MRKQIKVGVRVTIPVGTLVHSQASKSHRVKQSVVTVREMTTKMSGVVQISWKSRGYKATTSFKR